MHSRLQQTHAPLVHSRADSAGRGRTACARLNTCTEWGAQGTRGVAESNLGHKHDLDMLVDGNRDNTLGGGVAQVCWQRRAGPPLKRVAVAERRRGLAPVGHKHWRCLQAQPVCGCSAVSARARAPCVRVRGESERVSPAVGCTQVASKQNAKQSWDLPPAVERRGKVAVAVIPQRPRHLRSVWICVADPPAHMHADSRVRPPRVEAPTASRRSRRSSDHQGQDEDEIRGKMGMKSGAR